MDCEDFRISGGRRGGRGGRRHRRPFFRRFHHRPIYVNVPYYYPRYYPRYYPVEKEPSPEYTDCVYATGSCSDEMSEHVKEYGERHVKEMCEDKTVQDYVQKLPSKCRPSTENYVGVL